MKLSQTYPAHYFGRQTLTALEDKVIVQYKNLLSEYTVEYPYSVFGTKFVAGKHGDAAWTTLGWYLFLVGVTRLWHLI